MSIMTDDEIIAVVQDHKDGKAIQYKSRKNDNGWVNVANPAWEFNWNNYRTKPEKKVGYVNVYKCNDSVRYNISDDRSLADDKAGRDRVACRRIEYEDGQFDD